MPRSRIGEEKTSRHNVSIEDTDWDDLDSLAKDLGLKQGVSSAIRALLRVYQKNKSIIKPLLVMIVHENDRIYSVTKNVALSKIRADKVFRKAVGK